MNAKTLGILIASLSLLPLAACEKKEEKTRITETAPSPPTVVVTPPAEPAPTPPPTVNVNPPPPAPAPAEPPAATPEPPKTTQ